VTIRNHKEKEVGEKGKHMRRSKLVRKGKWGFEKILRKNSGSGTGSTREE